MVRSAFLVALSLALAGAAPSASARKPTPKKTPARKDVKKDVKPPADPEEEAAAAEPAPPAEPQKPPPPVDPKVAALFDAVAAARDAAGRKAAVAAILALDPMPVADVVGVLGRGRTSTDAERRTVLAARGFEVPDAKGKFSSPGRQTDAQEKANA